MKITKTVLNRQEIEVRVAALGRQITADYQVKKLVLLGVLNGAFIFLADLARAIELEVEIDFICAASYGDATENSVSFALRNETDIDIAGKDILIIEEIVDIGLTITNLREHFMNKYQIASVKVCALLDKRERRSLAVQVDYAGFILISNFIVGYVLDYAQKWRKFARQHRNHKSSSASGNADALFSTWEVRFAVDNLLGLKKILRHLERSFLSCKFDFRQ